jgi:hypothetical protein
LEGCSDTLAPSTSLYTRLNKQLRARWSTLCSHMKSSGHNHCFFPFAMSYDTCLPYQCIYIISMCYALLSLALSEAPYISSKYTLLHYYASFTDGLPYSCCSKVLTSNSLVSLTIIFSQNAIQLSRGNVQVLAQTQQIKVHNRHGGGG